jgi:hypothetical protein
VCGSRRWGSVMSESIADGNASSRGAFRRLKLDVGTFVNITRVRPLRGERALAVPRAASAWHDGSAPRGHKV